MNQHNTRLIRLPEVLNRTGYGKALDLSSNQQRMFPITSENWISCSCFH